MQTLLHCDDDGIRCGGYTHVLSMQFFNMITIYIYYNDAYYPYRLIVQYYNPKLRNSHSVIAYFV